MSTTKRRLTVTVDPQLVEAGNAAVAGGQADSLSGWVVAAMAEKVARDAKLGALQDAIADYEAEFGEITAAEIAAQTRADRAAAAVVRGRPSGGRRRRTATSA